MAISKYGTNPSITLVSIRYERLVQRRRVCIGLFRGCQCVLIGVICPDRVDLRRQQHLSCHSGEWSLCPPRLAAISIAFLGVGFSFSITLVLLEFSR